MAEKSAWDSLTSAASNPLGMFDAGRESFAQIIALLDQARQNPDMFLGSMNPLDPQHEEIGGIFRDLREDTRSNYPEWFAPPLTSSGEQFLEDAAGIFKPAAEIFAENYPNEAELVSDIFGNPSIQNVLETTGVGLPLLRGGVRGILNAERKADIDAQTIQRNQLADPEAARLAAPAKLKIGGKQEGIIMPVVDAINRSQASGNQHLSNTLRREYIKAKDMTEQGKTAKEISMATGLHPVLMDNGRTQLMWEKPREIKPQEVGEEMMIGGHTSNPLPTVFNDDLMFELVPEFKKMGMQFEPQLSARAGSFMEYGQQGHGLLEVGMKPPRSFNQNNDAELDAYIQDMFDTGIHELGHANQKVFKLPEGGNPAMFSDGRFNWSGSALYPKEYQDVAKRISQGEDPKDILKGDVPDSLMLDALQHLESSIRRDAESADTSYENMFENLSQRYAEDFINETTTAEQKYRQLWGEAASNADMARNKMSEAERRAYPYSQHMADVAGVPDESLLRYNRRGNVSYKTDDSIFEQNSFGIDSDK